MIGLVFSALTNEKSVKFYARMMDTEMGAMIWLRKSADFELPLVRQRTLGEAQDFLCNKVVQNAEQRRPTRQGLLVIAFGTKAQCFQWNFSDNLSGVQRVMTVLGDGAVLDIGYEEERTRFEELFGKWCDEAEAAR